MLWAYDSSRAPTPYDPQGAKRLLASEGWEDRDGDGWLDRDGRKFEFTLTTNADNALRMQAIVPVQAYWKAIGVKVQIQALEMQTALGLRAERRYQAYFGGWNAGLSPSGTIESLWSCSSRGGRSNFVDFCHPEVDSLNVRMAAAVTPAAAVPFAHRIQALITAEHPYTWMYNEHTLVGVASRVQGVTADPRGAYVDMDSWSVQETAR